MQLDSLIWETASPRTHKPKIVNESLSECSHKRISFTVLSFTMSLALFCIIYSELCQYQFSESSEFSVREIPVEISHHTLTCILSSAILQSCSHKRISFTFLSFAMSLALFCIIYSELCQYQFSESSEFSVREIPVEISHHTLTCIPSSAILQVCVLTRE